jgi:SAM-dependent methyltransferase
MPSDRWKPAADLVRRAVDGLAARHQGVRSVLARSGRELTAAADRGLALAESRGSCDTYGGAYFGEGRDGSGDRGGRSGYARYDRVASNADIAGWLVWRNFRVCTVLDVGCATGYLVEVLRERGLDAEGCDFSQFAVDHATPGAAGHVRVADLFGRLPWEDGAFELVTALEILEHLPPGRVGGALAELARVCGGHLFATIPSFGANRSGADGHFEGKVRPERVDHYRGLGPAYRGPVPGADLALDADGRPVEGHLTIASFEWWTEQFADAGFLRCTDVEQRLYADIEPAGLAPFWNLYVFRLAHADPSVVEAREPDRTLAELGLVHPLLGS